MITKKNPESDTQISTAYLRRKLISAIRRLSTKKTYLRQKLINLKNKVIGGQLFSSALRKILPLLEEKGPEETVNYLQKKYRFSIYPPIRFLKHLYQFSNLIKNENLTLWNTKKSEEKVMIHFCCWGMRYANKVKDYLLPSLLSENNLPLLAKQYNVVLFIHCDQLTKDLIKNGNFYEELIKHTTIEFCVFPETLLKLYQACEKRKSNLNIFPMVRYLLLGVCQTHAFQLALKNSAYISFLMPDVALSESFMSYAFEKAKNKKVIFTTTYRTNHHGVSPDLKKYYVNNGKGQQLTISAKELTELQIKHIHPNENKRIVSTTTQNFTPVARLLFKNKKGVIIRGFHQHPIIINCKDICDPIKQDYLPIDNTVLNYVLDSNIPYQDQAWVCDDACQMAIMELSDENPESEPIINAKTLSYQELQEQVRDLIVKQPLLYDSPLNQFLVSHRHRLMVENSDLKDAGAVIDDAVFFSEIYNSLDRARVD